MKYFNFFCDLKLNNISSLLIKETATYCSYLGRMYEFYFQPIQTNKVSALRIYLQNTQKNIEPFPMLTEIVLGCCIDWNYLEQLTIPDRPLYIIELLQNNITDLAKKENWELLAFETAFQKIIQKKGLFRDYWKQAILSPNKQLKAQIYFEDDYENNGTYIHFLDKKNNIIKQVQFTPRGYSIYCKDVGTMQWINDYQIKIYHQIGSPASESSKRNYWIVSIDGLAQYYYSSALVENPTSHSLFSLGILYWEGKIIMQDKNKGLALIEESSRMGYKHAQKWLKLNAT